MRIDRVNFVAEMTRADLNVKRLADLAQFAQVFKPVIDAEDARVGVGVQ